MRKLITFLVMGFVGVGAWGQTNVKDGNNNSTPIYVNDGNIGVGTASPETKLDVNGVIRTYNKSNSIATWDNLSLWSEGEKSYIYSAGDERGLFIKSNGGNKIILESFVGIGISTPSDRLHVNQGNIKLSNSGSSAYGILFDHDYSIYPTAKAQILFDFYGHSYGGEAVKHGMIYQSGRPGIAKHWFIDNTGKTQMMIDNNGYVGIGVTTPAYKLDVAGTIRATEIKVEAQTADFVFEENYDLKDLSEVETFIKTNKHLPNIPSATQMEEQGVNLAEMNKLLLQKVEELTLHTIAQEKKLNVKDKEVEELKERLAKIEKLLAR